MYQDNMRSSDVFFFIKVTNDSRVAIGINYQNKNLLNAYLEIARILFICLLLAIATILITQDIYILLIHPLESIFKKLKLFAENPLLAVQQIENEIVLEQQLALNKKKKRKLMRKKSSQKSFMETSILENTVRKIAALITIALGDAGSEIISKNIKSNGNIDPIIPGKKVFGIFGFIHINDFELKTEVFEEMVLEYVNIIGEIVHKTVDRFYGFPNKNIGDTFLLVWKFPHICFEKSLENSSDFNGNLPSIKNSFLVSQYADMALISFIKIQLKTYSNRNWSSFSKFQKSFPNQDYLLHQLSMGLHVGWAIEGAIGSFYKIEASYLSPNVNLSARICSITKYYGTHIMFSNEFHNHLSQQSREYVRLIDKAILKGCQDPISLYTVDLDFVNIQSKKPKEEIALTYKEKCKKKYFQKLKKAKKYREIMNGEFIVSKLYEKDSELCGRVNYLSPEFYHYFSKGVQKYLEGNWQMARDFLIEAQNSAQENEYEDVPTGVLLIFMRKENFEAPDSWKGYRVFDEK